MIKGFAHISIPANHVWTWIVARCSFPIMKVSLKGRVQCGIKDDVKIDVQTTTLFKYFLMFFNWKYNTLSLLSSTCSVNQLWRSCDRNNVYLNVLLGHLKTYKHIYITPETRNILYYYSKLFLKVSKGGVPVVVVHFVFLCV